MYLKFWQKLLLIFTLSPFSSEFWIIKAYCYSSIKYKTRTTNHNATNQKTETKRIWSTYKSLKQFRRIPKRIAYIVIFSSMHKTMHVLMRSRDRLSRANQQNIKLKKKKIRMSTWRRMGKNEWVLRNRKPQKSPYLVFFHEIQNSG